MRIEELVKRAVAMQMPAVAVTDWNNLYGLLHFAKACKEKSGGQLKPIYGAELGVVIDGAGPLRRHVVLLAENLQGYDNLKALVSKAHTQYGYSEGELKPYIPFSELAMHNEGIIALTAGMKGLVNSFLVQDQQAQAQETLEKLIKIYGEKNLFLELQEVGLSVQSACNEQLIEWGKKYGIAPVATSDVHYLDVDDAFAQEIWMTAAQKLTLEENMRSSRMTHDYCLMSPEEMRTRFSQIPEACDNTLHIAERCHVELKFKDKEGKRIYHLPSFESKDSKKGALSSEDIFAKYCEEGLAARMDRAQVTDVKLKKIYADRLDYEIKMIQKMGFASYYLIVSDFIRWAKKNDIPVGPGRGSGAGSLAAYVLDVTDIDPIENGLFFERFLNPERVSLPDFDIDFCQERRHEVIQYVAQKYSQERVCQIVTFAKEQSKNAIKDVGRVLGLSFAETNRLTKLIPSVQMKPLTVKESLEEVAELKSLCESDAKVKQVMDLSQKIEGSLRQAGVHAAGVIIASRPVSELAPMSRDVNGNLITQWDMKYSEEAGLVKFDFLGLVTLDLLHLACSLVNQRAEEEAKNLHYDTIPVHDPRAYEMISKGDTMGLFQLESSGMQNLCTRIRPDSLADVAAINALYRPGPLESGMVDDYINRKHGRTKVGVMFPEMESSLRETYGVIVYQEQVMEISRVVGGYTLGGADLLRRAMGKKDVNEMQKQRAQFIAGAEKNGKPGNKSGELFDLIEKFAGYGFNKSHAVAYAVLAVRTAFLKAVYPTEFFTAILTIERDDTEKLARYIQDAKNRGIEILPPDVNESDVFFTISAPSKIRFGLAAIKNVGESAVEAIRQARAQGGPFKNLFDFLDRVDSSRINKRTVESLVQAGAFDSLQIHEMRREDIRARYLASLEKAMDYSQKTAKGKASGQVSFFDGADSGGSLVDQRQLEKAEAIPEKQIFDWEKQLLGIFVSGSPLLKHVEKAKGLGAIPIFSLGDLKPKSIVTVAALVLECREVRIKRGRMAGEMMGILKLEDTTGQVEMVSFPQHFKEFSALIKSGEPLMIKAELDFEEDKPKLIAGESTLGGSLAVIDLNTIETRWPKKLKLELFLDRVEGKMSSDSIMTELARILSRYPGTVPVHLRVVKGGSFVTDLDLGPKYKVHPQKNLMEELNSLLSIPGSFRAESVL